MEHAMNRRKALGVAAGGLAAAGAVAAGAQEHEKEKGEARVGADELKGADHKPATPPERVESKELTQAHSLAFISGSADLFMISHHGGGVVLNLQGEVAANHAAAREDAHFFYLSMSSSVDLPEFAVSKAAGWGGKHMVWSRHGGGAWAHYERATQKRLEGNLIA